MEHSSIKKSLSFDDVLIKPARSSVLPSEVSTFTKITTNISLGVPLISSAMDTVTEYKLAIAIAQSGGMGILHKNMSIDCLLYTSPSPRDRSLSRMPSSA